MNRKLIATLAAVPAVILLAACNGGGNSGQAQENRQQNQDQATYEQAQPIPHFPYSVYREVAIDVEADQALGLQTTSFFFDPGTPDPIFTCPSMGQPFPNTAELSNPAKAAWSYAGTSGAAGVAIGQMDPSGVYTPSNSTGTYVLCINGAGQKYLQYWEGFVDTVSGAARWDSAAHQIVVTGAPAMPRCTAAGTRAKRVTTCTK